jgi:hypothetical protein
LLLKFDDALFEQFLVKDGLLRLWFFENEEDDGTFKCLPPSPLLLLLLILLVLNVVGLAANEVLARAAHRDDEDEDRDNGEDEEAAEVGVSSSDNDDAP